ncbi:TNF receptor-associated factor 1-like [Rhincodon typus]|uniref:TNF receptor-associated factor 1-like n=1 Tax=Rhincodon typus TaxID=259920 RepID=UPI00202F410A|nr:TNF receptor-associated factor 1-like [Rhincodon typus]
MGVIHVDFDKVFAETSNSQERLAVKLKMQATCVVVSKLAGEASRVRVSRIAPLSELVVFQLCSWAHEGGSSLEVLAFFTSHCGYMLCLRLYLNGDGVGANTHLSLFLVIMKGRYDAILEWPFSKKVTFRLLDQSARRQHTVTAFKPDIGSASFHRPVQAMNVASGCPEFLPLAQLHANWHSYVTNDVMFIKASVDT